METSVETLWGFNNLGKKPLNSKTSDTRILDVAVPAKL